MYFYYFSGIVTHEYLGLLEGDVNRWFAGQHSNWELLEPPVTSMKIKNPEIPILQSYDEPPPEKFWDHFPTNPLPPPDKPYTPINTDEFLNILNSVKDQLPDYVKNIADRCLKSLKFGADTYADTSQLGPLNCSNSKDLSITGHYFGDQLCSFIKDRFVAGPFKDPPLPNLRINNVFIIPQA